jgi:hypothetical protein
MSRNFPVDGILSLNQSYGIIDHFDPVPVKKGNVLL